MSEITLSVECQKALDDAAPAKATPGQKLPWEAPKMDDVSEEVMAQPYIRFT